MSKPDSRIIIIDLVIVVLQIGSILITAFGAYPFFKQMNFGPSIAIFVTFALTIGLSVAFIESLSYFFSRRGFSRRFFYFIISATCILYSSGFGYSGTYFSFNQSDLIEVGKRDIGEGMRSAVSTCTGVSRAASALRNVEVATGRVSQAERDGNNIASMLSAAVTAIEARNCVKAQETMTEVEVIVAGTANGTPGAGPTAERLFSIAGEATEAAEGIGSFEDLLVELNDVNSADGIDAYGEVRGILNEFESRSSLILNSEFSQDPFSYSLTKLVDAIAGRLGDTKDYVLVFVALAIAAGFDIFSVALAFIRERSNPTIGVLQNIAGHVMHAKTLRENAKQRIPVDATKNALVSEEQKRLAALSGASHVSRRFHSDEGSKSRVSSN